jgi:hypothetical protein
MSRQVFDYIFNTLILAPIIFNIGEESQSDEVCVLPDNDVSKVDEILKTLDDDVVSQIGSSAVQSQGKFVCYGGRQ